MEQAKVWLSGQARAWPRPGVRDPLSGRRVQSAGPGIWAGQAATQLSGVRELLRKQRRHRWAQAVIWESEVLATSKTLWKHPACPFLLQGDHRRMKWGGLRGGRGGEPPCVSPGQVFLRLGGPQASMGNRQFQENQEKILGLLLMARPKSWECPTLVLLWGQSPHLDLK